MVSTKLIRLVAAERRRKQEQEQAAIAKQKRVKSRQWDIEMLPAAPEHETELKNQRAEIVRLRRDVDMLLAERAIARGRPLYWG
jgi:hypothetical protein